jgi:5-methylcytosine-specific restriction endonuclease McrA
MEGWRLQKADYRKEHLSESDIWASFNYIFSSKSTNRTSYKYGFMKSLLENVFNVDHANFLNYEKIFSKFTEIYWALTQKYKLKQGDNGIKNLLKKTSVEIIFDDYVLKYPLIKDVLFENIKEEIQVLMINEVIKKCKKFVIGAIYGDSHGEFYSFNLLKNELMFNPYVLEFMKKYKNILLKLNHYEWAQYLEKINRDNSNHILNKLNLATKRINLSNYRDVLLEIGNTPKCFYCGKSINPYITSNTEVDHFIPWSFVRDDKIWNLVLSCRKCNNSKRDKLATEKYIHLILEQNSSLLQIRSNQLYIVKELEVYQPLKIIEMFKSAKFNGFSYGWNPGIKISG